MPPLSNTMQEESGTSINIPLPVCIIFGTILSAGWIASKWTRASSSLEAFDEQLQYIEGLINDNSRYDQDLLLEAGPALKSTLRDIYLKLESIKTNEYNAPAGILNFPARIMFRYHQVQEIHSCHTRLCKLEHEVHAHVQAMREARALAFHELAPLRSRGQSL